MLEPLVFPRGVHRLEIQPILPSVRQAERYPESPVIADGHRTFPLLPAVAENRPLQGNPVHRMPGVAGHLSGNHEKRVRKVGILLRIEGHFERRKDEVIDPD